MFRQQSQDKFSAPFANFHRQRLNASYICGVLHTKPSSQSRYQLLYTTRSQSTRKMFQEIHITAALEALNGNCDSCG